MSVGLSDTDSDRTASQAEFETELADLRRRLNIKDDLLVIWVMSKGAGFVRGMTLDGRRYVLMEERELAELRAMVTRASSIAAALSGSGR